MDKSLKDKRDLWEEQIEKVRVAESNFVRLDKFEKSLFSKLFLQADGSTDKQRESNARNHQEWITFQDGLGSALIEFNHERRILELRIKDLDSEYLSLKISHDYIRNNR